MVEFVTRRKHDYFPCSSKQKRATLLRDLHRLGALLCRNHHNHHNDNDDNGTHNGNDNAGNIRLGGPTTAAVFTLVGENMAIDAEVLTVLVQNEDVRNLRSSTIGRLQVCERINSTLRDRAVLQIPRDEQRRAM